MQGFLNLAIKILAFGDAAVSSNPMLKYVDWTRNMTGVIVDDAGSRPYTVPAGGSLAVFSGTRSLTVDGTTTFSLALSTVNASTYRLTATSGAAPGFRTSRALTPTGMTFTMSVNANGTLGVASSAPVFAAVVAGDQVFIPGATTGDAASPFSVLNCGFWQVLSVPGTQTLVLVRPSGASFSGTGEVVVVAANSQFQGASQAGVQVGDGLDISAGFTAATCRNYTVSAVTASWVEFISTVPLATETGIVPGASGIALYSDAKNFLYVESVQDLVVQVNGDTGRSQRTSPLDPSDITKPGMYLRTGPTWSLTLLNPGATDLNAMVATSRQG